MNIRFFVVLAILFEFAGLQVSVANEIELRSATVYSPEVIQYYEKCLQNTKYKYDIKYIEEMLLFLSGPDSNVLESFKHFDHKHAKTPALVSIAKESLAIDVLLLCNKSTSYETRSYSILAINELLDTNKTSYSQNKRILEYFVLCFNTYSNEPKPLIFGDSYSEYRARSLTKLTIVKLIDLIEAENLKHTDEKVIKKYSNSAIPR